MDQVRTCIGCRSRAPRATLIRVAAEGNRLKLDVSGTFPGRGAWLHPKLSCVETALERHAWRRALKVGALDASELREYTRQLSVAPAADATAKVERTMDQS